jgi:hypothetical protein
MTTKNLYRTIRQNIVCDRYENDDAAFVAIDEALEADQLTIAQSRELARLINPMAG